MIRVIVMVFKYTSFARIAQLCGILFILSAQSGVVSIYRDALGTLIVNSEEK